MKKTILSLFCIFFIFGSFVFAGKPDGKSCDSKCCDLKPCCKLEKMASILNLTEEQKVKIGNILKDFEAEKGTKKEKFGKEMLELKNKKNNKIKEILNEEQKVQFIVLDTVKQLSLEQKDCDFKNKKECCKKHKKCEECEQKKCGCKK